MFSSRGLFKQVACPGKHECNLPNCMFDHDPSNDHESDMRSHGPEVYDPASVSIPDSPPLTKRRKLSPSVPVLKDHIPLLPASLPHILTPPLDQQTVPLNVTEPAVSSLKRKLDDSSENSIANSGSIASPRQILQMSGSQSTNTSTVNSRQPISAAKTVSPPTVNRMKFQTNPVISKTKVPQEEPFHPRRVDHQPLQLAERDKKLKIFHKQLELKQQILRKEMGTATDFLLTERELRQISLDEEERIAKSASSATYNNVLAGRLTFHKRMSPLEYKNWVTEYRSEPPTVRPKPSDTIDKATELKTGLASVEKEVTVLKLLRTGLHQHVQHGYIVKLPSERDIQNAIAADRTNQGWENCDRCQTRFQVFHGRDATTGRLTSGGSCLHHWGRLVQGRHSCCNQAPGSTGCATSEHHVFKTSDPARLAAVLQFEETSIKNDGKARGPVVFDCEMGYTTLGFELLRVSALSWPLKTPLLDVLVQPKGEVLDLNTRFSGVTKQMFTGAPIFDEQNPPKYVPGELLQKVRSPESARKLLFDLLDPNTPLIGHAIDNDLNACRIIHPFVIDTVLLFPTIRGLPFRRKLKDLSKEHLGRTIQTSIAGGAEGHDSKEDSEATGDLARVKVRDKWNQLSSQGFWWKENSLMPAQAKPRLSTQTVLSSPRQKQT